MRTRDADQRLLPSRPVSTVGITFAIALGVVVGLFCALALMFTVLSIIS